METIPITSGARVSGVPTIRECRLVEYVAPSGASVCCCSRLSENFTASPKSASLTCLGLGIGAGLGFGLGQGLGLG